MAVRYVNGWSSVLGMIFRQNNLNLDMCYLAQEMSMSLSIQGI